MVRDSPDLLGKVVGGESHDAQALGFRVLVVERTQFLVVFLRQEALAGHINDQRHVTPASNILYKLHVFAMITTS